MRVGYIRVSTREQNPDRQIAAMHDFGLTDAEIVIEKQSGKDFERKLYRRQVDELKVGDVLVVKSIDRLGRNYAEILEQWRMITKEKGADIVVLDMPLLDTRKGRDLTGTLISDIVLQLLSYVAQTEREFIHQRQAEGIAAAKARGKKFGRPSIILTAQDKEWLKKYQNGTISAAEVARKLLVSRSTVYRLANIYETEAKA